MRKPTSDEMMEAMLLQTIMAVGYDRQTNILHISTDNGMTFYFSELEDDGITVQVSAEVPN